MTVPASYRERLTQARERTKTARQRITSLEAAVRAANKAGDREAQFAAQMQLEEVRGDLTMAQGLENALLSQIAGITSGDGAGSETFLNDPTVVRSLEQLADSSMPIGSVNLGPAMSRDDLVAQIESGRVWGSPRMLAATGDIPDAARVGPYYGIVPQLRRRLRLLDLIPTSPMDGRSFDYTQEAGSFDTAFETAEGAVKPEADAELDDAQVVAKTIAHWAKLKRQQLADVPALGTTIQQRLVYGVMRRVENQIVGGDGTGENLLGILNTTGIGDVEFSAGEPLTDLTLDAITTVLLSDAEPNAVVLNPLDAATMLKAKATGSGERLDSEGAFATTSETIWSLPRITSKVIPQGQALVGDWTNGCRLYVREPVNVRLSDSDQDDFIRNRVTMLGEGRFGLAVWQPAAFAVVHFEA